MCVAIIDMMQKYNAELLSKVASDRSVSEIAVIAKRADVPQDIGGKTVSLLKSLHDCKSQWTDRCVILVSGSLEYLEDGLFDKMQGYLRLHPSCDIAVSSSLEDVMSIYIYQALGVIPTILLPSWSESYMRADVYGAVTPEKQQTVYESFQKSMSSHDDWHFVRYIIDNKKQNVLKQCVGWRGSRSQDVIPAIEGKSTCNTHIVGGCICSVHKFHD